MKKHNNPSEKNESWARNRFNTWRDIIGLDSNIPIEDLSFVVLSNLLCKFFSVVCKLDGSLYPLASLMNMYMFFNRMICRSQEDRCCRTNTSEAEFKIMKHPLFIKSTRAVVSSMQRSRAAGVEIKRRKVEAISFEEERLMLDHSDNQANYARGAQKRFALYCFIVFLIRGNSELHDLLLKQFTAGVDSEGRGFLRYDWISKLICLYVNMPIYADLLICL